MFKKSVSRVAIYNVINKVKPNEERLHYYPSYEIVRWLAPYTGVKQWYNGHHIDSDIIKIVCSIFANEYFVDKE